jgi:hypothetical protein
MSRRESSGGPGSGPTGGSRCLRMTLCPRRGSLATGAVKRLRCCGVLERDWRGDGDAAECRPRRGLEAMDSCMSRTDAARCMRPSGCALRFAGFFGSVPANGEGDETAAGRAELRDGDPRAID